MVGFVGPADVVDDENRPVGRAPRSELLDRGLNFRTVHLFAFDAHMRLAMQRISPTHHRSPGLLGSTVAGYVKAGETYDTAIRRRTAEEVGVEPSFQLVGTLTMRDGDSRKFVRLYATALPVPLQPADSSVEAILYRSLDQIDALVEQEPELFTATFRRVYDFYRQER